METQRTVYVQYIRPALEYASPSWGPWQSNTAMKELQRVQNEALRAVAGLTATCPVDFLHLETGIEPLETIFEKNYMLMRERYLSMAPNDPRTELLEKEAPVKLKTRHGLRHATDKYPEKAQFARAETKACPSPWRITKLRFDKFPLDKKKEEYTKEELTERTEEKIRMLDAKAILYTDGSTSDKQGNGGAGM